MRADIRRGGGKRGDGGGNSGGGGVVGGEGDGKPEWSTKTCCFVTNLWRAFSADVSAKAAVDCLANRPN